MFCGLSLFRIRTATGVVIVVIALLPLTGAAQSDPAFDAAMQATYPLTPAQIKRAVDTNDAVNRALARPAQGQLPQPISRSVSVSLKPGAPLPIVLLADRLSASLSFLDRQGRPWKIRNLSPLGNPNGTPGEDKLFEVTRPDDHVLMLTALVPDGVYNIGVMLEALPTPLSITLAVGAADVHHARSDLHVAACRPGGCATPDADPPAPALDRALYDLVDGLPPPNSVRLSVRGSAATTVWRGPDGQFYINTSEQLILPACLPGQAGAQARRSSDGTRACITAPVNSLLVSRNGQTATVLIE